MLQLSISLDSACSVKIYKQWLRELNAETFISYASTANTESFYFNVFKNETSLSGNLSYE